MYCLHLHTGQFPLVKRSGRRSERRLILPLSFKLNPAFGSIETLCLELFFVLDSLNGGLDVVAYPLEGRLETVPVDTCEESRSFDTLERGPECRITLEDCLKHLLAAGVDVPWPVDLDTSDVLESFLDRLTLEGIIAPDELADQDAPRPNVSRATIS